MVRNGSRTRVITIKPVKVKEVDMHNFYKTYGKQLPYFREFKKFKNSFCGNYSRKYGKSTLKFVPLCKGKVGLQATCVIFIGNKIDVFFDAFLMCLFQFHTM